MDVLFVQVGVFLALFIAILGLVIVIYLIFSNEPVNNPNVDQKKCASLLAVIGSGGHTKELLSLIEHLGEKYQPRYYIMANTDKMSEEKVQGLESSKHNKYKIYKIPRSREVQQSWITTVLSTLYASLYTFPLVFKIRPDIILCNGPGTCIPVCFAGILMKVFYQVKVIYVESICRVETLSLSGKILYHFSDTMIVQWPQLQHKYPKSVYMGRIV
ncbi:UDP-N-acetylglucosamine transferase subunit ALG14 homolog [Mercenaria mercenaria]|uniref:UDP-N-acetylglucosamine transferase subunit ALG14 homolog n=1 Tax=Mercenaria mercenaria TaxID=6596 RepID=UPI00234E6D15|nr:UDP-N-acetylglucosamine transferase subunit ALG14 homolog [Mercenaria mercenaria]